MKDLWLALLASSAIAVSPAGAGGQSCSDRGPAFREIIDEFQSRQRNVGLAAAVLVEGDLAFAEAFGWADREAGRRATPETRFGVASITKAFTGLTLLRLAEGGRIDLDAEIQRYVPEFPRHPEGTVTVRHVAAQLGGIRHWGPERDEALYARRFEDVEDILPLFVEDPFVQAPGVEYSYSSYAYNLLAIAMQRATGERFQDLVRASLLDPLALESVAFDAPGFGGDRRAARYSYYDLTDYHELSEPVRVPDREYTHNMAGGNMVADIVDLVRLGEAALRPGFLTDAEHRRLWTRPVVDGVESPMSFGWFVRPDGNRLAISGSNPGLQAGMAVWKHEGIVVAVVANSWGIGSRSAELVDDDHEGLLGRLAAVCAGNRPGALSEVHAHATSETVHQDHRGRIARVYVHHSTAPKTAASATRTTVLSPLEPPNISHGGSRKNTAHSRTRIAIPHRAPMSGALRVAKNHPS